MLNPVLNPILQFGTSRFLQAHADLFISEALESGTALGTVTIVQNTDNPQSARRIDAFRQPGGFPVRIRGWQDGAAVDQERRVVSVTQALQTNRDWPRIRAEVASGVQVILSNTGDAGYALSPEDHAGLLDGDVAPQSFPAKLLVLLHGRFLCGAAPISIFPCELVANNGTVLRELVLQLARAWKLASAFVAWLAEGCVWVNSLVDRIVSEPLDPIGAVAEPYALWAIEAQPGMLLPCRHPQLVVTDSLELYERRKLFLLNLGHTFLAEQWLAAGGPDDLTVLQAMADPSMREPLESVWAEEVLPLFAALGEAQASCDYLQQVRDRFNNPFLAHRLADIAQNHGQKKQRRFGPLLALAEQLGLGLPQRRLRAAMEGVAA
ncbi:mannitol dehydrogenase family protein [Janthinobacterium sp. HLX7-2]|uniref:mannitol dehydrogenase family protein n=1 Tax=Janthinobacterium sp. HLX7-2 TaxID=1259331 RepID=UPI003F248B11